MEENPSQSRPALFDTDLIAVRRDRAQRLGFVDGADVLHRAVASSMAERLEAVTRAFADRVVIGGGGQLAAALPPGPEPRILEISSRRAEAAGIRPVPTLDPLPLAEASVDLIVSGLELHLSNDPVGQLIQMRRALRPDGLMIAALFAGQTLAELRAVLAEAESLVSGGLSPRVAPMAEVRDLGGLLQRAGFAMPVADSERFDLTYRDIWALMRDLRAMGETNMLAARQRTLTPRSLFAAADALYRQHFPAEPDRIAARFEIVYLTGWSPADNQPKPLRPGSATTRLADALGTEERPAGDFAMPGPLKPVSKE